jgi:hypothetical protein
MSYPALARDEYSYAIAGENPKIRFEGREG